MNDDLTKVPNDKYGLLERLNYYLKDRPDAAWFLLKYRDYCHAIDDLIDVKERRDDNEFLLRTFNIGHDVFSCAFYQAHVNELYSIVKEIHNEYCDSFTWENSEKESWHKQFADVMRSHSNVMIGHVVRIVVTEQTGNSNLGYESQRDVSWRAKSQSWADHHDEKGQPI